MEKRKEGLKEGREGWITEIEVRKGILGEKEKRTGGREVKK